MSEKQLIIYETKNGKLDLQLDLDNETLWLDRDSIAKLYNIDRTGVSRHINNILSDNEVDKETNVKKISMLNLKRLRYGSCCPAPAAGHPVGNADLS